MVIATLFVYALAHFGEYLDLAIIFWRVVYHAVAMLSLFGEYLDLDWDNMLL